MRRSFKLAVLVALLAIPAVATASSSRTLAINCGRKEYKPREIILTCADAGILVDQLRWSSWNATKAVATGSYVENTCSPTCSAGHTVSRPVKVTLLGRGICPGQPGHVFGLARLRFPKGTPPHAYHHFLFLCPP
jgi:hypothetical protein